MCSLKETLKTRMMMPSKWISNASGKMNTSTHISYGGETLHPLYSTVMIPIIISAGNVNSALLCCTSSVSKNNPDFHKEALLLDKNRSSYFEPQMSFKQYILGSPIFVEIKHTRISSRFQTNMVS